MTTRGEARLRNESGVFRQSVRGAEQDRQGEVSRVMHSAWCWDVISERTSMKAEERAGLVCWSGVGWQRKRGTGCVCEM